MNKQEAQEPVASDRDPYEKPRIQRVDLALAETLSAGCKLKDVCDDPFTGTSVAGS